MAIELYEHQKIALDKLRSGSILVGGVGSGKSITALAYYYVKECDGKIKINGKSGFALMKRPKDLYIISTARKRDTLEWEKECIPFLLYSKEDSNTNNVKVIIDSWNNIAKYTAIKDAFFIFDEQRVVGSGTWVKSFLKITEKNRWILLSATPGDNWMDYIPVFVANKWYKNRTEFIRRHVIFSRFAKYPKVDRYVDVARLFKLKDAIVVKMDYTRKTVAHDDYVTVPFNKEDFNKVLISRWNIYEKKPIKDVSELCYLMRKVVNSDLRRISFVEQLFEKHQKIIVFYNFNYELDLLLNMADKMKVPYAQWNGHRHELIPETDKWLYFVQYAAGAEGWNCIETNAMIFYSQNYSYKATTQAAGRIDRLNTPFVDLYYYHLTSTSTIDLSIKKAFDNKKDFNEPMFMHV